MAATYTFGQLETLWRQAGGPAKVAPVMAGIALAESGGKPRASHRNTNGTIDRGLWQINSVHGYSAASSFNPSQNARQAVAVYHSQGLRAWSTYTNGAYKQYVQSVSGSTSFGILNSGNFAGVDQGVDYRGAGIIPALDPITITSVRRVSILEGGSWPLVGFRFTAGPYKGRYGYVMENFQPKVKVGQKLKRGQPIGVAAGSYPYVEYGFASGPTGSPLAPLGSDPHAPTQAGQAFLAYIQQRAGSQVVASSSGSGSGSGSGSSGSGSGGGGLSVGGVASAIGSAAKDVTDPLGAIAGSAGSVASGAESIGTFLTKLADPHFWLRALEVVGGGILVILGLYLLARQVGLAQPVEGAASTAASVVPVGRAAKLSEEAAAGMQLSAGTAAKSKPSTRRTVHRHYLEEAPKERRISDPATNEIPF